MVVDICTIQLSDLRNIRKIAGKFAGPLLYYLPWYYLPGVRWIRCMMDLTLGPYRRYPIPVYASLDLQLLAA